MPATSVDGRRSKLQKKSSGQGQGLLNQLGEAPQGPLDGLGGQGIDGSTKWN